MINEKKETFYDIYKVEKQDDFYKNIEQTFRNMRTANGQEDIHISNIDVIKNIVETYLKYSKAKSLSKRENELVFDGKIKIKLLDNQDVEREALSFFDYTKFYKEQEDVIWGILINTEGIWLLCNDGLAGSANDRFRERNMVLEIVFGKNTDQKYLSYLSYDNILGEEPNTYFFRDIITYRNKYFKGTEKSWTAYHSTLKRFMDFCIKKRNMKYLGNGEGVYNRINQNWFQDYIESRGNMQSLSTVKNTFFYIKHFMGTMTENTAFEISSKELVARFPWLNSKVEQPEIMDALKLKRAVRYLEKGKHGNRDAAILFMLLSFGLERRNLCQLEWEKNVDIDKKTLKIGGRIHVLPEELVTVLKRLKKEQISSKYVFYSNSGNDNQPIRDAGINEVLGKLAEVDRNDTYYRQLTPANIRNAVFKHLLRQGERIEEIIYLLGIDISNLSSYISNAEIRKIVAERQRDKKNIEKHPMEKFFEKML